MNLKEYRIVTKGLTEALTFLVKQEVIHASTAGIIIQQLKWIDYSQFDTNRYQNLRHLQRMLTPLNTNSPGSNQEYITHVICLWNMVTLPQLLPIDELNSRINMIAEDFKFDLHLSHRINHQKLQKKYLDLMEQTFRASSNKVSTKKIGINRINTILGTLQEK